MRSPHSRPFSIASACTCRPAPPSQYIGAPPTARSPLPASVHRFLSFGYTVPLRATIPPADRIAQRRSSTRTLSTGRRQQAPPKARDRARTRPSSAVSRILWASSPPRLGCAPDQDSLRDSPPYPAILPLASVPCQVCADR